jgi:23S rRNA pseudouridine1911/1915/1917 synthase
LFEVKEYFSNKDISYVYLYPQTGRTHQLRVHLSFIGNPILGDKLYGAQREFTPEGVALHAYKIKFYHPLQKEEMEFIAPEPEDFKGILKL